MKSDSLKFLSQNPVIILKSIAIIDYFIILCVLFNVLLIPSSKSYEVSLYDIYPWYIWIGLAIPLILPFLILSTQRYNVHPKMLLIFFSGAVLSLFLLLSLPAIRNYPFYGDGDIHQHLGLIYDLGKTGNLSPSNPYPIVHILASSFSLLLIVSPEQISLFFPQIFMMIYIVSLYLLSKSLDFDSFTSLIILSLGFIPIFGSFPTKEYIFPSMDAFFLFPLFLCIFLQSRSNRSPLAYTVLIVLILLLIPFFHPELLIFSAAFIFLYLFLSIIFTRHQKNFQVIIIKNEINISLTPILYLVLGFGIWFLSYSKIGSTIRTLYNTMILNLTPGTPPLQLLTEGFKREIIDALQTLLFSYGSSIIFLILGLICFIFILIKILHKQKVSFWVFLLGCSFIAFIFLNIVFLFKGTAIGFHIYRQIKYTLLLSTLLIGFFYSRQIFKSENKNYYCYCVIVLILISTLIGIFNIYPSPITEKINAQPTISNIAGISFFFDYRDPGLLIMEAGKRDFQNRYAGYLSIENRKNIRLDYSGITEPISHFGYNESNTIRKFYSTNQYMLIYPPSKDLYSIIFPKYEKYWKFSPNDYELLKYDPSINYFYNNGEIQILEIFA